MTHYLRHILVACAATLLTLALGEGLVRVFNLDERYMAKVVYRNAVDRPCLEPVVHPVLFQQPKPGHCVGDAGPLFINSQRARSPERPVQRPPGVFRIVVTGGSNVWGAAVGNDETWPARLEAALNDRLGGGVEVWNYGLSASVGVQQVVLAQRALDHLNPDLIIMAPSNTGAPPFLIDALKDPILTAYPQRFLDLILDPRFGDAIPLPRAWKRAVIRHSRLARFVLLGIGTLRGDYDKRRPPGTQDRDAVWEARNVKAFRAFVEREHTRVKIAVVLIPGLESFIAPTYTTGINAPIIQLDATGKPREYLLIHPPADVLEWYGQKIAEALIERGLVPAPAPDGATVDP